MGERSWIGADSLLTLASGDRYDVVDRYQIDPAFRGLLQAVLPADWVIEREGMWLYCLHPSKAPAREFSADGFKIHLSSNPQGVDRLITAVAEYCAGADLEFKVAADPTIYLLLNSKQFPRGSSGKLITIYPGDHQEFEAALADLHSLTQESVSGAYILSDRRYRDSPVLFYRYGGIRPSRVLQPDGTTALMLTGPDGEVVPDQRLPYFNLPPWVRDPLGGTELADPQGITTALAGRFEIDGAIYFSNSGGVYTATDARTDQPVVIKEARPGTNLWRDGTHIRDSRFFLEREYTTLHRLTGLPYVPNPIAFFHEWEHAFLVESRLTGVTLESHFAHEDRILAPYINRPGRIEAFLPSFVAVANSLLDMLLAVHARGVILGDLSPRNILIDSSTAQLTLIDFESAVALDDASAIRRHALDWGTPGFFDEARGSRNILDPLDDLFSLSRVLLSLVVPINDFLALNPNAKDTFLGAMSGHGLPELVPAVLAALENRDVKTARAALARLASATPADSHAS